MCMWYVVLLLLLLESLLVAWDLDLGLGTWDMAHRAGYCY
jgi:hypothetical protein